MKVLFVCNQNENRSKTAETMFGKRHETKSAGLYCEHPITGDELSWADVVLVMEDVQRTEISRRFPKQYMQKRIVSLGIEDVYRRDQPELVTLLETRVRSGVIELY